MKPLALCTLTSALAATIGANATTDPRLREVAYDANAVVTVPVKRGVVTLVMLGADEAIAEVAAGLGGDCKSIDAAWCIAAQAGGRTIFVKPKGAAHAANTLAVVTDRRVHNFKFTVLAESDAQQPIYRLIVKQPAPPVQRRPATDHLPLLQFPPIPAPPDPERIVAERMQARPQVMNAQYAIAEGHDSEDIVPTLVFDDGRFTYLRFPGNREVPAVFHVQGDGSETLVNARMEDDLLVVDRVSRRLMLRAGSAVVGVWNEAFDLDGAPPVDGTAVPGVQRVVKSAHVGPATSRGATP